jgi:hypothetical protein
MSLLDANILPLESRSLAVRGLYQAVTLIKVYDREVG